jgi:hypothetical protein
MINAVLWQHVSFVACVLCAVQCTVQLYTLQVLAMRVTVDAIVYTIQYQYLQLRDYLLQSLELNLDR